MEITELLVKDHREVDELFRRYHLAEKADTIEELADQIVHDLSVHAAIEEQFVYPLLRAELREGDELGARGAGAEQEEGDEAEQAEHERRR